MPNLIVRNLDEAIVNALKQRAALHGWSAEAEHREILRKALLSPQKKSLTEVLLSIPGIGADEDFSRDDLNTKNRNVFD